MVYPAMQVAEILSEHGLNATVVNARFAKPLDTELILPAQHWSRCHPGRRLSHGRLWFSCCRSTARCGCRRASKRIGVPDVLVDHAGQTNPRQHLV